MPTKKKKPYVFISIFVFIFIAVIATIIFVGNVDYSKGRNAVEATVFQERYHSKLRWYATYTVNGQTYKSLINGDNSNLHNGKTITVYYDINNPNKIWRNSDKNLVNIALVIVIGVFAIICALIIFGSIMAKKKQRQLEDSGELYEYKNPYESNNSIDDTSYKNDVGNQNNINKF